jgi:hypothetical protein
MFHPPLWQRVAQAPTRPRTRARAHASTRRTRVLARRHNHLVAPVEEAIPSGWMNAGPSGNTSEIVATCGELIVGGREEPHRAPRPSRATPRRVEFSRPWEHPPLPQSEWVISIS